MTLCWATGGNTAWAVRLSKSCATHLFTEYVTGTKLQMRTTSQIHDVRRGIFGIMRITALSVTALLSLLPLAAGAAETERVYKWVDETGQVHYGDSIPPEFSDLPKQILNDHGVIVDHLEGRKTPEQVAAEKRARELALQKELQNRADQALLQTYLSVDEIVMHRDRRIELFQAQSRVTELYLRNLERRLTKLKRDASRYRPYSEDPDAPLIDPDLVDDINDTQSTIARHQKNLLKFQSDEQQMIARFEGDINRFKSLKGVTD